MYFVTEWNLVELASFRITSVKPSTIASFTSLKVLVGDSDLKFASEVPFVKVTKFEGGSVKQSCCLS